MSLLTLLFPSRCILCRRVLDQKQTDLCPDCSRNAPRVPGLRETAPWLDRRTALWYYEDSVRSSLLRYKFNGARSYAPVYARLLAEKLVQDDFPEFDLLTWVPVSPLRRLTRGYDQVELLAQALGQALDSPPVRLLRKIRHTPPQSGIETPAARRANVLGAFQVLHPQLVHGRRILLLDDIITTGATSEECARILRSAGAVSVTCAAVAKGRHHTTTSR